MSNIRFTYGMIKNNVSNVKKNNPSEIAYTTLCRDGLIREVYEYINYDIVFLS